MGKIGDLFVRLGLKSDDYKKGIEQAKRDTQNFGSSLKSMSALAKTAWAAAAAAVVKFAADAVKMTQKWGDQFNIAVQGMKAGYGAFVRGLASGEGFNELFENIRTAVKLAREAAAALDEVFERKISFGYSAATTENEIAQQQLIMRDSSKSDKEREAAAKRIIELEAQLGREKKDIWAQEANAQRDLFKSRTQMNDEEIDFMVRNYNQNRNIIKESRAYLAERKRLQDEYNATLTSGRFGGFGGFQQGNPLAAYQNGQRAQEILDQINALDNATSQAIKDVAALTVKYDKGNDELVANMANAEVAVINVDTEVARAQTRATAMLGTLTKAANTGISTGSSEKVDPGLSKALGIQQGAEDSFKSETQLLTEKYNAEKALLEKYQLDTTALTKKYYKDLFDILDEGIDEELAKLSEIEPIELDLIDMSEVDAELEEFTEHLLEQQQKTQEAINEFSGAVVGGFADACEELMGQLMGLEEFNPGSVVQALLTPLCDLAEKAGAIIMAEGLATIAAKSALETFGVTGWGAVAAGAALIAAGAAAKAGLAALAGGSGTAAANSYAGASGNNTTSTQNIESEMTIYVTGRLSGNDIIISGQKTANSWAR